MSATLRIRRKVPHRRLPGLVRLSLETLETRLVPTSFQWTGTFPAVAEVELNDTIIRAQDLGNLTRAGQAGVTGTISNDATGGGVDWYQFTLTAPADVHLATLDKAGGSQFVSVLSLYNNDAFDFTDALDPLQHRLLAQDDGSTHGGDATIDRLLGAGTYYVAVSGAGNLYFHPQLPDSGYAGSTGDYGLAITTTDAGIVATDGPAVLTVDPAPGSTLARSPFMIRADLSEMLDPGTFIFAAPGQDPSVYANPAPGQTVELRYSATGDFSAGHYADIPITPNFSSAANELQIVPAAPLAAGIYQLFLAGNSTGGNAVLADLNGVPLGTNRQNPNGADYISTFQINGIDGVAGATTPADTVATAHDLKDITTAGLVQALGAIGVDPTDSSGSFNGAAVEMYHFTISGSGKYAFSAEVFARRIGSPLDPAVTLFQRLPDGSLRLVGLDDNTGNNVVAPDGTTGLLLNDAALFEGLTAGDYFVAVSSAPNFPDASAPWQAGPQANGSFDPTTSQSANAGTLFANTGQNVTIGPYVLNLAVSQDNTAPTVVATTPAEGATLAAAPTQLSVQFSKPMNLLALANQAFQQTTQSTITSVYVLRPSDGQKFFPRVQPFDPNTNTVPFLMLDDLPNGTYELHLSGPQGLTDFAGNALAGNSPSGDYVVTFRVQAPAVGVNGDPLQRVDQEPNADAAHAQDLGVLFPKELAHVTALGNGGDQAGVTVTRDFTADPTSAPADTADFYRFQVLQNQTYVFTLNGLNLPAGVNLQFTLWDSQHNLEGQGTSNLQWRLAPGTYVLGVTGWTADVAAGVAYQLNISLAGAPDNPPPLTYGAGPAIRFRLATNTNPPPSGPTTNPTTPPASNPPANPPPDSSNPPPPANVTLPPPPPSLPPVSPTLTTPPATPPATDVPSSAPLVSLTPSSPLAPPRLNLPIVGPAEAPPTTGTTVVSATPSTSAAPTASALTGSAAAPLAPAPTTGSGPAFGAVPSSLLLALGSGPAGGVQTFTVNVSSPAPDRVVVQGPNPINVDGLGLVRITTLTQASQLSGNDSKVSLEGTPANPPSGSLPGSNAGLTRPWLQLLRQALDSLFGMRDWLLLPLNLNYGQLPMSPDGDFNDDNLDMGCWSPADQEDRMDEAWLNESLTRGPEAGWSGVMVALGAVALVGAQGPRRRSQARVRLRRSDER